MILMDTNFIFACDTIEAELRLFNICKNCFKTELRFIKYQQKFGEKIDIPIRWITYANGESIRFDRKNRSDAYKSTRKKNQLITTRKYKAKENKSKLGWSSKIFPEKRLFYANGQLIAFYTLENPQFGSVQANIRLNDMKLRSDCDSMLIRQTDFVKYPIEKIRQFMESNLTKELTEIMLFHLENDLKVRFYIRTNLQNSQKSN